MDSEKCDQRVLVLAPGRDGHLTCKILGDGGFACRAMSHIDELLAAMDEGVGMLVLAEEVLASPELRTLAEKLAAQPPWSDLPVLVIGVERNRHARELEALEALGNVSVLVRPLAIDSLRSAVASALRARRRQYEVRDLLRERGDADRRKDEFLAMLAHELRNPLAPIQNAVHVLRLRGSNDPLISETRDILDRQIRHLARLVDDLLDVSRITRGKIELKRQRIELQDVIRQVAKTIDPLVAAKGHRLSLRIPEEPVVLSADPTRVEQVVLNVLNNAVKYTPKNGTIDLSLAREGQLAVVRIKDDGIGIERMHLGKIFDLFAQADRPLDRTQGGLGIGLTVVKKLVELHGGTVDAMSDGPGLGTEIVIRLPVTADQTPPLAPAVAADGAARPSSSGARILIVEDNEDGATMLGRVLGLLGHEIKIAPDGPTALRLAPEFRPHLVLMDVGLPGMDGYQVARALRGMPWMSGRPIIAVTGYGKREDVKRAMESGFDHHMTKPIDFSDLERFLAALKVAVAEERAPVAGS